VQEEMPMSDPQPRPVPGLGSLAQSARTKNLNSARWILIAIGVLTLGLNLFMFFNVTSEADKFIEGERKNLAPGTVIDPVKAAEAKETIINYGRLIYGGGAALGLVFIVLGIVVYQVPVVATVLGLVLYIGGNLAFAALEPESLARGIIIKVIVIVGLFKAIQTAVAYERERRAATDLPEVAP
jgi:hypothetical protein